jgi:hypothetical protein
VETFGLCNCGGAKRNEEVKGFVDWSLILRLGMSILLFFATTSGVFSVSVRIFFFIEEVVELVV